MATTNCTHSTIEVCAQCDMITPLPRTCDISTQTDFICQPHNSNFGSMNSITTVIPSTSGPFPSSTNQVARSISSSSSVYTEIDEEVHNWLQPPYLINPDKDYVFNNIVGHEDIKKQIRSRIIEPLTSMNMALPRLGGPSTGMLFYGVAGCGKTELAMALMNEIRNAGINITCFKVSGADLLSRWMGESEQKAKSLFTALKVESPSILWWAQDRVVKVNVLILLRMSYLHIFKVCINDIKIS